LNLKCDILVSKFAFKCNLYRCYTSASYPGKDLYGNADPVAAVGLCTS
jgi:hypothetical protein